MAYTVLNLITRSMRLLQLVNEGDNPSAAQEQDGLEALNGMVDAWAIDRLLIYATTRAVFPFAGGKESYEIGPNAADWVAPRPSFIDGAGLLVTTGTETDELEIKIWRDDQWRDQRVKNLSAGGNFITRIYYDYGYSNADTAAADVGSGTVYVWPVPIAAGALALYTPAAVAEFTSINQRVALPPGYRRPLAFNLAVEIAAEYGKGSSVPQSVLAIATESKEALQRMNLKLEPLKVDVATRYPGQFNIFIGE
jgi:hypothetical protein